jgi:hypothetical protein
VVKQTLGGAGRSGRPSDGTSSRPGTSGRLIATKERDWLTPFLRCFQEDHTKNEPVKKFSKIMSSVIEDWTMVIPFGERVTSNLDE